MLFRSVRFSDHTFIPSLIASHDLAILLLSAEAGALLVSAIMVMPASIAMRLGLTFKRVLALSVLIGFIGMLSGLVISYQSGAPASATITLVFVAVFIVTLLAQKLMSLTKG